MIRSMKIDSTDFMSQRDDWLRNSIKNFSLKTVAVFQFTFNPLIIFLSLSSKVHHSKQDQN